MGLQPVKDTIIDQNFRYLERLIRSINIGSSVTNISQRRSRSSTFPRSWAGDGLEWISNCLKIKLVPDRGLVVSSSGLNTKLKTSGGLDVDSDGLFVDWTTNPTKVDFLNSQFDKINVTLANTGLSVDLEASKSYWFRAVLFVDTDATGGHKYAISGTAVASSVLFQINSLDNGSNTFVVNVRGTALNDSGGNSGGETEVFTEIIGFITVSTAGTLTIQFAQDAVSGTSSVLAGSYLVVQEII